MIINSFNEKTERECVREREIVKERDRDRE